MYLVFFLIGIAFTLALQRISKIVDRVRARAMTKIICDYVAENETID